MRFFNREKYFEGFYPYFAWLPALEKCDHSYPYIIWLTWTIRDKDYCYNPQGYLIMGWRKEIVEKFPWAKKLFKWD